MAIACNYKRARFVCQRVDFFGEREDASSRQAVRIILRGKPQDSCGAVGIDVKKLRVHGTIKQGDSERTSFAWTAEGGCPYAT